MSAPPPRSRRALPLVTILLLLALGIAGGVWYAKKVKKAGPQGQGNAQQNGQQDAGRDPKADAATASELARLNNLGLGRLENNEAAKAVEPFETILNRRPELVVGPRNLTVARLIQLAGRSAPPDSVALTPPDPALAAQAQSAVAALRKVEPNAVETAVLAARIAAVSGDGEAARAALAEAARIAPKEAWVHYERYRLDRNEREPAIQKQAEEALGAAYAADPTNVWVTLEWLTALARRHDPAVVDVLEAAKPLVRPFAAGIEQRARVNVLDLIDKAQAAARDGQWPVVMRNVGPLGNVFRPEEVAQSDHARVDLNSLEFVAVDFPATFYESAGLARRPTAAAIPVTFAPGQFGSEPIKTAAASDLAAADFDLDEKLDLLLLDGPKFTATSLGKEGTKEIASVEVGDGFASFVATDLDLDADAGRTAKDSTAAGPCHSADLDLIVYGPAGVRVYENRRDGDQRSLVPVEQDAALAGIKGVLAAAAADFDLDGDLDLVVSAEGGLTLWANVGGLKFQDRTPRTALPPADLKPTVILPVDLDRDVDLDLVLAGGNGPAGYLENLRHGNLRWRECDAKAKARAVELADADGNASWDLLSADEKGLTLLTTQTPQQGRWVVKGAVTVATGAYDRLWQLDYDNDGLPDLLARGGGKPVLLRNLGGTFEKADLPGDFAGSLVAADYGDLDGDGDLDLLLASKDAVRTYENRGGNAHGWIDVALLAQQVIGSDPKQSGRVNHAGIGSLLELKSGPLYQPAIVRKPVTHFGLGAATPDVIRVIWTNGIPENVLEPKPKQFICEREDPKGSCPFLYTFDGQKFVFSTDLCWAAPIGLVFAEGIPAPCRSWEFPMITSPLRPDAEGNYVLQITEELWEAAYFDQVELIAVDHPPAVRVFTNEKVGPPDAVAHRLYTATHPRPPVAARDGKGRDILPSLAKKDGRYVRAFDERFVQGLCEPHAIELDFGDIADAKRVTLFLTGWLRPTDTSINVALGQRSNPPKIKRPALSVPNERGEWVEVLPNMGFPGGKTKPIVVDLTGKFLCDDRRVRIDTNMELYWDEAFVTVDEPAVATITRACPLAAADLHHRGVSARTTPPGFGPTRYDYDHVLREPAWPAMRGNFTRYGDVTELAKSADDRQIVITAGDEVTLRFAAPEPPPAGWTRSFVIHDVGYDKDADLNTVYGQTAEPLPFLGMADYPYEPGRSFPDSPALRRYLAEHQTRSVPQRPFWTAIRDFEKSSSIPSSGSPSLATAP
jgi:hypothetical protein